MRLVEFTADEPHPETLSLLSSAESQSQYFTDIRALDDRLTVLDGNEVGRICTHVHAAGDARLRNPSPVIG